MRQPSGVLCACALAGVRPWSRHITVPAVLWGLCVAGQGGLTTAGAAHTHTHRAEGGSLVWCCPHSSTCERAMVRFCHCPTASLRCPLPNTHASPTPCEADTGSHDDDRGP